MCSNDPASERRSLLATLTGGPTLTLILTQLVATILALGIAYAVVCRVLGIARYPHVYTPFALATVFCGIVIGLTIAFGYRTFRKAAMHLIEPLTDMAATAARLTRTRETTRFATNGGILEIDQIAETLNALYTAQEHQIDELTDLVRALMHDIRTPLNHITGAAEEIGQQKGNAQDAAARIAESCRVISRLIDDHTEITLNNSRSDRTPAEPVDFTTILADGCELYQSLADVRNQKIALHLPESPLILLAHKSKLQRLLGNLLDNAIKYSPDGAVINVAFGRATSMTSPHADTCVLKISNPAPPIPPRRPSPHLRRHLSRREHPPHPRTRPRPRIGQIHRLLLPRHHHRRLHPHPHHLHHHPPSSSSPIPSGP